MAHHKRRRPKHQRSGCIFCKPHKDERESTKAREHRVDQALVGEGVADNELMLLEEIEEAMVGY